VRGSAKKKRKEGFIMRKIVLAVVLMLAVPSVAAVNFTAVDEACGAAIYYNATGEPNLVRAFALDITVDSGATVTDITDYKEGVSVSGDKGYGIFPGSIDINEAGDINDVGTPVADPCQLPSDTEGGLGTAGITIEMGSLYVGSANAPDPCGLLCKVVVDADCNVTIVENVSRGKVVMEGATQATTNLPVVEAVICAAVCCPPDGDANTAINLADYYDMQNALVYANYLWTYGYGNSYNIPQGDATVGHLYNDCWDTDANSIVNLADYYECQNLLVYANYLKTYGYGNSYSIDGPTDPIAGHLWPCP
jgi:hypothetical protein